MCSMSLTVVVSARSYERRDAAGHLVGRQAGVLERDRDDRNADVRKDVGRRAQRRERPDDQDQQRQHDERVRAMQRDANDPIHARNPKQGTGQLTKVCADAVHANTRKDEENFMCGIARGTGHARSRQGPHALWPRVGGSSFATRRNDGMARPSNPRNLNALSVVCSRWLQRAGAMASTQHSTLTRAPPVSLSSMRRRNPCRRTIADTMLRPRP